MALFEIKLPALKERKDDIPELIDHFLANQGVNNRVPKLSAELIDKLKNYDWPGNIRELRNAVEKMKILHSDKEVLGVEDFEFDQLENYSTTNVLTKKELPTTNSKNVSIDAEEDARIKKIIAKGFKIESREQYLKEIFIKYKKLSRSQVVEILKVSPLTAANTLHSLNVAGFIVKRTPSKSSKSHYYELAASQ